MRVFSLLSAVLAAALSFNPGFVTPVAAESLDGKARAEVTEAAAQAIEEHFFDEARGEAIAQALRKHAASGGFAGEEAIDGYTQALGAFLADHDAHFSAHWSDPEPASESVSRPPRDGAADNYGFVRSEILPGNVGYIRLDQFYPAEQGADTALAALRFVANSDAVIFDVRANGGGAPSMVQFLISHFLEAGADTVINTFVSSTRDYPEELLQLDWVPGPRRPDVPIYVLTSARSASAGEAFPYHLQAMERATIVGERTAGAGNPGEYFDLGQGFSLFVATGSARNPITGTNWEGEGVMPDIAVESEKALDAALDHAYGTLREEEKLSLARRDNVEYAREALSMGAPLENGEPFAELAGDYGRFTIEADEDGLTLRNGRRPAHALVPAGEDRFFIEDLPYLRVHVDRSRDGRVEAITVERAGSRPMRIDRSD